jgi:hypothetical protein
MKTLLEGIAGVLRDGLIFTEYFSKYQVGGWFCVYPLLSHPPTSPLQPIWMVVFRPPSSLHMVDGKKWTLSFPHPPFFPVLTSKILLSPAPVMLNIQAYTILLSS